LAVIEITIPPYSRTSLHMPQ